MWVAEQARPVGDDGVALSDRGLLEHGLAGVRPSPTGITWSKRAFPPPRRTSTPSSTRLLGDRARAAGRLLRSCGQAAMLSGPWQPRADDVGHRRRPGSRP